jgi:hypothetical protein
VSLTGVHLIGILLINIHLIGIHLLQAYISRRQVFLMRGESRVLSDVTI